MSRPIPGKQYTIVDGDTLSGISAAAYGNGKKWPVIWKANQTRLKSGDPNLIYPGEVIVIPGDVDVEAAKAELAADKFDGETKQDATITIDGKPVYFQSMTHTESIDNALDAWALTTLFDPDDEEMTKRILQYSYGKSQIYLGKELAGTGYYYTRETDTGEQTATLEFWSLAADMIDSNLKPGTYEAKKITLSQRAKDLADGHGIKVIFDLENDDQFERMKAEQGDTIGAHLMNYAKQKAGLMTSTPRGELLFTQAATGKPVASFVENTPPLLPNTAKFDGRARYASYLAIGKTTGKTKTATSKDNNVPKSRSKTFSAPDTRGGDIQTAADWERNKALADSMSINLPLSDWYDPSGKLYRKNTIVEYTAPIHGIKNPSNFLVRSVSRTVTANGGRTCTLNIVPPQVYTGGEIVEPWLS
jgi:LysM repeat protein